MKNEPVFPTTRIGQLVYPTHTKDEIGQFGGLTKREYFAGLAMSNLCNTFFDDNEFLLHGPIETGVAKYAVAYADALIAELEKGEE
jgi:hypothetical protein